MDAAIGGGRGDAPVDLTEGACLNLAALMAIGHLGTVGHRLGLNPTGIPELCAAVAREGRKHGTVREHPDPGQVTRGMGSCDMGSCDMGSCDMEICDMGHVSTVTNWWGHALH